MIASSGKAPTGSTTPTILEDEDPATWYPPWQRLHHVGQGLFLLVPGLWLGLFPRHYRRVHQVERDYWIERVHSMWLSLVGAIIAAGGVHGRKSAEIRALSLGSSIGMAAADITAARKTGVAPIYYLDLAGQLVFAVLALIGIQRRGNGKRATDNVR